MAVAPPASGAGALSESNATIYSFDSVVALKLICE
jgi:hypothetical protein